MPDPLLAIRWLETVDEDRGGLEVVFEALLAVGADKPLRSAEIYDRLNEGRNDNDFDSEPSDAVVLRMMSICGEAINELVPIPNAKSPPMVAAKNLGRLKDETAIVSGVLYQLKSTRDKHLNVAVYWVEAVKS